MMDLKSFALDEGWNIAAPCMHKECALKNDYCQFYARVERSSLHKLAKNGTLSYEDEKYFYLRGHRVLPLSLSAAPVLPLYYSLLLPQLFFIIQIQ